MSDELAAHPIGSPERLADLRARYEQAVPFPHAFWATHLPTVDLQRFRGHKHYLTQFVDPAAYAQMVGFLRRRDEWRLLDTLGEDGAFGAITLTVDGTTVSRDLLDSAWEILYLRLRLNWTRQQRVTVLDLGAGYGRLAHRLTSAMPNSTVYSVDAIPESTWLCESYLAHRGVSPERAPVIPFDELGRLAGIHFDVAVAAHVLEECAPEGIAWWFDLLARLGVPALMVVTDGGLQTYVGQPYCMAAVERGFIVTDCIQGDVQNAPICLLRRIAQVSHVAAPPVPEAPYNAQVGE